MGAGDERLEFWVGGREGADAGEDGVGGGAAELADEFEAEATVGACEDPGGHIELLVLRFREQGELQ